MKKSWTDERLDLLKRLTEEGLTIKEICSRLGTSRAAISYARKHYGIIILRPWSEKEDKLLLKLCDEGISCKEIAEELGRTTRAVIMRKHTLGIRSVKKTDWDECIKNLKEKYNL